MFRLKSVPGISDWRERVRLNQQYRAEIELVHRRHRSKSAHASVIHFSFNKSATQYVKSILVRCASHCGMSPILLSDYAFNSRFPYLDHLTMKEMEKYRHVFCATGYVYTPFGGMVDGIENLDRYRVILLTRDPRDILVSEYYSVGMSHAVPVSTGNKREAFLKKRTAARAATIDEYVLSQCDRLQAQFVKYDTLLLQKHQNVFVTSYEAMIADFPKWLDELIRYCGFNLQPEFLSELIREQAKSTPTKEDVTKHVRKGRRGDHLEKLQSETLSILNRRFESFLNRFDYV